MQLIYTISLLYSIQCQITHPNQTEYLGLIKNFAQCTSKLDCHHGNCINGKCECDKEWRGNTCNEPFCVFGKITGDNKCSCYYGHTLHNGYCDINCEHGNFSQSSGTCACNTGWKHASFSDTINWFNGICNQFKCQSDYHCQQLLPHVKEPSCPVIPVIKATFACFIL